MKLQLNKTVTADKLLEFAAAERWRTENAGTFLGPLPLRTDVITQGKATGAVKVLENEPEGATIDFKGANGWNTLDLAAMLSVGLAIGKHIQACFSKEKEISEQIAAGTITTLAQVTEGFSTIPSPGFSA